MGACGSSVDRLRLRTSWLPRHLHASVGLRAVDAACCRTILISHTLCRQRLRVTKTAFDLITHCYQYRPTVLRSINQQRVSFVVALCLCTLYLYSVSTTEPVDRGKPGQERLRTICARSISAWRRQGGSLWIDRHSVNSNGHAPDRECFY